LSPPLDLSILISINHAQQRIEIIEYFNDLVSGLMNMVEILRLRSAPVASLRVEELGKSPTPIRRPENMPLSRRVDLFSDPGWIKTFNGRDSVRLEQIVPG
jgi:hypothetical protein